MGDTGLVRAVGMRLLVVLAAGALLAGCGVPTRSDVHVEGPLGGPGPAEDQEPLVPPGPDDAHSAEQLVEYFLQAAAADPDKPVEHLREFIHADQRDSWDPDPRVTVVRVEELFPTPGDRVRVQLDVRAVGTLSNGVITPLQRDEIQRLEIEVASESPGMTGDNLGDQGADPRFRIVDPPDVVLLWDEALAGRAPSYLTPSPIYFWDSDQRVLVPDLRWLPTAFGATRRAQTKLEWLVDGPAAWLEPLSSLPADFDLEGNVVAKKDRFDVTLTPAAGELSRHRLHEQLWWTLHAEMGDERSLRLTIDGQEQVVGAAAYANPIVTSTPPPGYVVLDGAVVPYEASAGSTLPASVSEFGSAIHAAALSQEGQAALVHVGDDGRYRLSVATQSGVTGAGDPAAAMSRPTWLRHPGDTGLVVADGRLHRFSVADPGLREVTVPGLTQPISTVTVAPDGRRVALIADGRLYVSSLARREDGAVSLRQPRRLPTSGSNLAGVTFLQENWLAVIGEDERGRMLLYEISIDGGFEQELTFGDLGAPENVTGMVGYPGSPLEQLPTRRRGEVLYEQDGDLYRYRYLEEPERIRAEDLAAELPEQALTAEPRAPFYTE